MNFIFYLIFLGNFIHKAFSIQLTAAQELLVPVFQPVPTTTIDTTTLCPGGLTNSIQPFSSQSRNYVALSLQLCGVYIYDVTDLTNPNVVFSNILIPQGKTLGITYSSTTQYLWIAHQAGYFFGINTAVQPFTITVKGASNGNLPINKVVPWTVDNHVLFLMCYSQFQIFQFTKATNSLQYLQGVTVNGLNTLQIEFIQSYTFALVTTANIGVQFFLLTNGKDIENITFTYTCVLKPYFFDVNGFELIDDFTIAVMELYRGITLIDMTPFISQGGKTCNTNSFVMLDETPTQGLGGQMYLSQDKRYLFSQFRSVGVRLYDMINKSFQIIQNIFVDSNCNDIILDSTETILFYSNAVGLQIFEKTAPNFNRDVPNLLLNTYQQVEYTFFKELATLGSLDYQCILKENISQLYLARANFGAAVFKYSQQGIMEVDSYVYRTPSLYALSQIVFLADGQTAYMVYAQLGLYIVNFADPTNPVTLKQNINLKSPYVNFNFLVFFANFQLGLVCNYINGYIISIADPMNPFIIGVIDTMTYTLGDTSFFRVTLKQNFQVAYLQLFSFGVLVADISNPLKPQITSKFFTDGCYDFKLTSNEQYGVIAAAYQGIIIVKIQSDNSLVKVSQVKIVGCMFNILLLQNDQYILGTTDEYPSISLVSIVDIENPVVVQIIGESSAFGYYSMCLSSDGQSVFVTSQFSLLLLQLQNQIILHTQIYNLIAQANSNEYLKTNLPKGTPLQIGQIIEMYLVPIYQTQNIVIRQAYYYQNYVLQQLPSWMTFSPSNQILTLHINKDSLQKNSQGQYVDTIQQVVFTTYQSVVQTAFMNTYLSINAADSITILTACVAQGYVDNLGFIQPSYNPSQQLDFGINQNVYLAKWVGPKLSLVLQFIQYILNQNIINYTTNFYIQQSIQVNLQNKTAIISSLQNDITIQLQVLELQADGTTLHTSKAQFVNKVYSSVLMLLSSAQDQIKLEGTLENVNSILEGGLKFSINKNLIKTSNILIEMDISDGVNYDYINTIPFSQMSFLSLQAPIIINSNLNLQRDFSSKYPGGEVYIEDQFQYQVSSEVFTQADQTTLQYTAQIYQGGQFVNIPKDSWIQFSPTDRMFSGTPPASNFNDHILVQVNATDGYSYTVDSFSIVPDKIPFQYAFQLAIQILGPVFGILGFYKYKHFMYNILFKHQYIYSKDVVYVGEVYRKQITITDERRDVAEKLWKFFYHRIGEVQILHQLSSELMRKNQVTSHEYYSPEHKKQEEEDGVEFSSFEEETIKKMYPFGVNEDELGHIDKKFKKILIESSSKLDIFKKSNVGDPNNSGNNNISQNASKNENTNLDHSPKNTKMGKSKIDGSSSNVYKIDLLATPIKSKIKRASTIKKVSTKKIAENIKYGLNVCDNISRLQHLNQTKAQSNKPKKSIQNLQIFEQGKFNFVGILKYIKEEQEQLPEKKRDVTSFELKQLSNPTSLLSQAVCCLLVDYLLSQDKVTKNIFDYMHQKACKYYREIDWYKAYMNIRANFEEIHANPYPQITTNEKTVRAVLTEIFRSITRYHYDPITKAPKPINFSYNLLMEAIKARAIGITLAAPPLLQVTQGESIHTFTHLIHSVKAFEKNSDIPCCLSVFKMIDMDYIEKGLTDNEKLPSWIHSIDLINGTILLSGVPEKKDIGSIIIKIIDDMKFIVRSYQIQVLQKETENPCYAKPIIFSNNELKCGDNFPQHSNLVSALNSSPIVVSQNIPGQNRQKKISVFAPTTSQQDYVLNQSQQNLITLNSARKNSHNQDISISQIPMTERINQTVGNNGYDDISQHIISPRKQLMDLNDQTVEMQDHQQNIEMSLVSNNQFGFENEKEQDHGILQQQRLTQLKLLNQPESYESISNQLLILSENKNSPINVQQKYAKDPQNQPSQGSGENIFKKDGYPTSDNFIPPTKIYQQPQDMPNQSDYSPPNQSYTDDDRLKNGKKEYQGLEEIQERQMSASISQSQNENNQDMTGSRFRMFQYS